MSRPIFIRFNRTNILWKQGVNTYNLTPTSLGCDQNSKNPTCAQKFQIGVASSLIEVETQFRAQMKGLSIGFQEVTIP